ncbi:uncharacterized protein C6orf203 homolog [Limulus polyphemus]|uniref:Uncharacterized protein C6orf203 homolog n=1 Tax=Limulus polyphemus TaxID=6850 RepID=A0ABM1S1Y3_LIMPO|nr:uncharacterized protein C6orf203 homolog [Limulus polyphemus]
MTEEKDLGILLLVDKSLKPPKQCSVARSKADIIFKQEGTTFSKRQLGYTSVLGGDTDLQFVSTEEFEDDDEEEEDRDDENEAAKDYKDIKANLNSLRLDVILKHGLGMSRSKAEEAFYESRIRVNGEKILKKSAQVQVGNEIDLIKGINSKNENFLDISRVIVQRIESRGETEKMSVVLRRFKNMVIENYDTPWNHSKED